jgi:CheY-like chemotaxis protein
MSSTPPMRANEPSAMSRGVVLLVDDDANILHFVSLGLQGAGYEVLTAASARDALELNRQRAFDAVLLDYGLPEMTGIEVLERVRRAHPQIPAILSSGRVSPQLAADARRLGIAALEKPYRLSVLIQALEDALATRS